MGLLPFALNDFKVFFTLFPKCFSSFVHTTCSLSVLVQYLAFAEVHLRFCTALSNCATLGILQDLVSSGVQTSWNGTFALLGRTFQCGSSDSEETLPSALALQFRELPVPSAADSSLGSSLFTRRYSGNHGCFLVLRSMICLSSAGFPALQRREL